MKPVDIKVKYFTDKIDKLEMFETGDWCDLRVAEDVHMEAGEYRLLHLGVAIQLPSGYEAIVAPRSSTYKNWGIGFGIGKVDGTEYIPIAIERQYAHNKSLEFQVNYNIDTHKIDGGQIMHKWHF